MSDPHVYIPKLIGGGPDNTPALFMNDTLALDRCPRCGIAKPMIVRHWVAQFGGRCWCVYVCAVCQQGMLVSGLAVNLPVTECLPSVLTFSEHIPEQARDCLKQAAETLAQPIASLVVSAAAVDAMLKAKGLKEGTLYARIDKAAKDHLITDGMAQWAHQVRLDANAQRHADESAPKPTQADAQRSLDFAVALGEFLFVLPARVTKGISQSAP